MCEIFYSKLSFICNDLQPNFAYVYLEVKSFSFLLLFIKFRHHLWLFVEFYGRLRLLADRLVFHQAEIENSILLEKLFWPTVSRKTFEIRGWRPRICKNSKIPRTVFQTVKGQTKSNKNVIDNFGDNFYHSPLLVLFC